MSSGFWLLTDHLLMHLTGPYREGIGGAAGCLLAVTFQESLLITDVHSISD